MFTKKRGFTLLELLIVMGIISLLSVVMFRTYTTVSQITFRLQREKNLMAEVLYFSQALQNISEKTTIDYDRYATWLQDSQGITNILYLTGSEWSYAFFTTGLCIDTTQNITGFTQDNRDNPCVFVMQNASGDKILLTQSGQVQLSRALFKIIPYTSNQSIMTGAWFAFKDLHQPGFWLFVDAYSPAFGVDWTRHVRMPIQQFFSLN